MSATIAPTLADQLLRAAFDVPRDPRSAEYKAGARAVLDFRTTGRDIDCPHPVGSAQSDAFNAGVQEGHAIWRMHLEAEKLNDLPDRAALEIAHRQLCTPTPLDQMLANKSLRVVIATVARRHLEKRSRFDPKKLQANDHD